MGAPSRTRAAASATASRIGRLVTTSPAMRSASSTGTALAERMLRVRVKRAVLKPRDELADQRHAQLQAVEAPPVVGIAQPAREQARRPTTMRDEQVDAVVAEEVAGGDQHAGDERQLAPCSVSNTATTFGTTKTSSAETMAKHMTVSTIG